jgi:hypothetical protein
LNQHGGIIEAIASGDMMRLYRGTGANISRYELYEKSEIFDIPINVLQQLYH